MGQYEIHAFVCTQGPWCPRDGDAEGVHKTLKKLASEHGLKHKVRINHSGCLNQCGHGPMMVVYPENVWYHHLDPAKARQIFEEHFLHGQPVQAHVYVNQPGANKVPRDEEGNLIPQGE
jgi:(2Fe-2S) ferredoxin